MEFVVPSAQIRFLAKNTLLHSAQLPTFDTAADGILSRMRGFEGTCDRVLTEFQIAVDEAEQYRKQQQRLKEQAVAESAWAEFGDERADDNADMFAEMEVKADVPNDADEDNPWANFDEGDGQVAVEMR